MAELPKKAGRRAKVHRRGELPELSIRVAPKVDQMLAKLAESGFYGNDQTEVAERLLTEYLRQQFEWASYSGGDVEPRRVGGGS